MTGTSPIRMSQGYDVLPLKTGKAYPIPCDEWNFLKQKLERITDTPWKLHTFGSLLLGASASTLITVLTGALPSAQNSNTVVVAWAVVAVTAICGAVCLHFADRERRMHRVEASDVVTQMELIEKRYQTDAA
jgi:hypothetical protein